MFQVKKKRIFQGCWSFAFKTITLKTLVFFIISSFYFNIVSMFKSKNKTFKLSKDNWNPEMTPQARNFKGLFPLEPHMRMTFLPRNLWFFSGWKGCWRQIWSAFAFFIGAAYIDSFVLSFVKLRLRALF